MKLSLESRIDLFPYLSTAADPKAVVNPVGLTEKGDAVSASTFLPPRSAWVLLTYREDEDGIKEYQPIWSGEEATKLCALFEARLSEEKKKASGAKGKPPKK